MVQVTYFSTYTTNLPNDPNADVSFFNADAPVAFGSHFILDFPPGTNPGDEITFTDGASINATATYVASSDDGASVLVYIAEGNGGFYIMSRDPISPGDSFGTDEVILELDGGTVLHDDIQLECFAAGTLIATPTGERPVEALEIGDLIMSANGQVVAVKWIGRQTRSTLFTKAVPVRVCADAFGVGLPHTDLVLTADHALVIDGLAINASALVNGTSIYWETPDRLSERITYYHVETEDHVAILANGVAAETFIDYNGRRSFDNYAEYIALYGEEHCIREMDMPRVSSARLVPPDIRERLKGAQAA